MKQKHQLFNVGDTVRASSRQSAPFLMKVALLFPQKITKAYPPFYQLETGWSVNLDLGDRLSLFRGEKENVALAEKLEDHRVDILIGLSLAILTVEIISLLFI